jgi:hypothetical protein
VAAELKKSYDVEPTFDLVETGTFDVFADGKRVFCMEEAGRFPKPGETTDLIRKRAP